jgi:hypothetical protein
VPSDQSDEPFTLLAFNDKKEITENDKIFSSWKTYRNEKYQFEFKYPSSASVNVKNGLITIEGLDLSFVPSLNIKENNKNLSLLEVVDGRVDKYTDGIGNMLIGNQNAVWISSAEMGGYAMIVVTANFIYSFNGNLWNSTGIIDTFKFINVAAGKEPRWPSIILLSPKGGEEWPLKSIQTIKWVKWDRGPGISSGNVSAYLETKERGAFVTIGKVIRFSKGSIVWRTGEVKNSGNFVAPGTNYYIRIVDELTGNEARNDIPFSII